MATPAPLFFVFLTALSLMGSFFPLPALLHVGVVFSHMPPFWLGFGPACGGFAPHVGGDPPHPPCFCPPTHPFCSASWHGFMPKGNAACAGDTRPFLRNHLAASARKTCPCGKQPPSYPFSESLGGLCTKDLPLRQAVGIPWRPLHEGRVHLTCGKIVLWRPLHEGRAYFAGKLPPAQRGNSKTLEEGSE